MPGLFHVTRTVWKQGANVFQQEADKHKQWYSKLEGEIHGQAKSWLGDEASAESRFATEHLLTNIKKGIQALDQMAQLFPQMESKLAHFEDQCKGQFSKFQG
jgi:uncharacterized protein YukE